MHEGNRTVVVSDGHVALCTWAVDDAQFIAASFADGAVRRYNGRHDRRGMPAPPPSVDEAQTMIEGFDDRWRRYVDGDAPTGVAFAVVDEPSGDVIGCCGVDHWSEDDVAQIGYWLAPRGRGRGCATRAASLLRDWLFELGAARVFMTIVADDEASIAVARRAGFTHEGTMRAHSVWQGARVDVEWFAALASDRREPGRW